MQVLIPSIALILWLGVTASPAADLPHVAVGAIRWDAWSGGVVTDEVSLALTPEKYHFRLPWFAEIAPTGTVRVQGGSQEIMDQEITYAADAGLDYWAFVMYREGDQMSRGLELYLASKHRDRLRFCLILHNNLGVPEANWPSERDRVVRLLREPSGMTVCGGRPLVYMFTTPPKQRLDDLKSAVRAAGLLAPYCVYMGFNPAADWQQAQAYGFDAISAYACGAAGSYSGLRASARQRYWEAARQLGIPLVPLATLGWDRRPRIDRPPPWEANNTSTAWVETASAEEIAAHVEETVQWTRDNVAVTPARAVIVYAWNEHDEGGWLCPTWRAKGGPDTSRVEALGKVLLRLKHAAP